MKRSQKSDSKPQRKNQIVPLEVKKDKNKESTFLETPCKISLGIAK